MSMPRQVWAFVASLAAGVAAVAFALSGRMILAMSTVAVAAALWFAARYWNRQHPLPFPYSLRWFLRLPRPFQTPSCLIALLGLEGSERVLEVGPGVGTHALPVAAVLSRGGRLILLDLQRAMLE